ncbi:hypothetical protein TNCV_586801 [Trichonephila clavipes]|nr:hypothetical protein TNCV_586801 [Trichonephila clavipes]
MTLLPVVYRPRCIDCEGERRLLRITHPDRRPTITNITRTYNSCDSHGMSQHMLQHTLLSLGMRNLLPNRVPALMPKPWYPFAQLTGLWCRRCFRGAHLGPSFLKNNSRRMCAICTSLRTKYTHLRQQCSHQAMAFTNRIMYHVIRRNNQGQVRETF